MQEQLDRIETKLDQLLAGATPSAPGGMIAPGANGLAIIDGVVLAIDEPIAADWKVSTEVRVLCAQGRVGREPSNAFDSGLPKRSPAGYPMVYGVGAFGPQTPGRVKYGQDTFANDGEVAAYKEAIKVRDANVASQGGRFSPS